MISKDISNIIVKYLTTNKIYHGELLYKTKDIIYGLDHHYKLNKNIKYSIYYDWIYHWMIMPYDTKLHKYYFKRSEYVLN